MSTAFRSVGLLSVVSTTPPGPSRRAPCIHARLHPLATNPGEKCELGFTLLEILLALSVLSVILLLLLSAFTGAARVRETLSTRSRGFRQIRLVLDRVGTDLMGAFATTARVESALSLREDQLSGMPAATLTFTAFQLPDGDGNHPPAEIVKIRYFPRIGADGVTLELHREQSDLPFIENKIPSRESVVADGLRGFRIELYDGTTWVKEWPAEGKTGTALPKKAAVTLVDAGGETYRREVPIALAGQEGNVTWSGRRPLAKP
ncbi:MAG TPA: prepilin-type N-terminal cleavage/methylation domain-containing protein [Terriglobales bacterium]|nr:prepilin-type N-terminal cleavage/methylation domain-containing protein [Terriglobales bacterium]